MGSVRPPPLSAPELTLDLVGAVRLSPTILCLRPAGNPSINSYLVDPGRTGWVPGAALDLFNCEYSPSGFLVVGTGVGAQFAGDLAQQGDDANQSGDHPAPLS